MPSKALQEKGEIERGKRKGINILNQCPDNTNEYLISDRNNFITNATSQVTW
jgi:hypothetical protein